MIWWFVIPFALLCFGLAGWSWFRPIEFDAGTHWSDHGVVSTMSSEAVLAAWHAALAREREQNRKAGYL